MRIDRQAMEAKILAALSDSPCDLWGALLLSGAAVDTDNATAWERTASWLVSTGRLRTDGHGLYWRDNAER